MQFLQFFFLNEVHCFITGNVTLCAGEACWWTIHPASKQRSEGEKVRVGDDLILVSVSSERYLVRFWYLPLQLPLALFLPPAATLTQCIVFPLAKKTTTATALVCFSVWFGKRFCAVCIEAFVFVLWQHLSYASGDLMVDASFMQTLWNMNPVCSGCELAEGGHLFIHVFN